MADANITELRPGSVNDPTNARAPRAQIAHVEKPNDFKSDVTVSVGRWNVADVTAYVAAIGLAGAAAWFSIRGMVVLFPGRPDVSGRHGDRYGGGQARDSRMARPPMARHGLGMAF